MKAMGWACAALLVTLWPVPTAASGTLDFQSGGYGVEMEIGDDAGPTVARVRFFPPGDATGIALRPRDVRVEAFDMGRRRLHLEHRGTATGAPAFDLRVDGDRGVLEIGGQALSAPFDWQM